MPPFVPRKRRLSSPPTPQPQAKSRAPAAERKPTLFDTLDAAPKKANTTEDDQAFLDKLNEYSSDSSLTDFSSFDFEDVDIGRPSKQPLQGESDDEDVDWEDAVAPTSSVPITPAPAPSGDLELTLDKAARHSFIDPHGKKKGPSKIERHIRVQTHCMHVQFLLFHNLLRNAWTCDQDVQKILLGHMTPRATQEMERWQNASGIVLKRQEPREKAKGKGKRRRDSRSAGSRNDRDWGHRAEKLEDGMPNLSRGDPTIRFLKALSMFWRKKFCIDRPGLRKQGYKPLPTLEEEVSSFLDDPTLWHEHGERIESLQDYRALAKEMHGSRDVGAQLFAALLRALGFEARLVASLQPVGFGWSKNEEAAIKKKKGEKQPTAASSSDGHEPSDVLGSAKRKRPKPSVKKPNNSGSGSRGAEQEPIELSETSIGGEDPASDDLSVVEIEPLKPNRRTMSNDADLASPIYWTEVLSPITNRYIAVDPLILNTVAHTQELLATFEPRSTQPEKAKQVLAYVVAFSSDGTAKDVTVRYLKRRMWPGKTKGVRMPVEKVPVFNHRGKTKRHEEFDWFKSVMSGYSRSAEKRTSVDDLEEEQDLKAMKPVKQVTAGEETLQGYKSSAAFVLERHLRREEALLPAAKHVKMFKSGKADKAIEEKVFRRADVVACKTSESWHKEGLEVKAGEHPLKLVPIRAMTLNRKREVEQAEVEAGEKPKQGLYSRNQTDWIIPPPIENGVIPRNAYGNIDCFVPSMVPKGAVHMPYRGLVKVCRRLNIDYAEAVVGFEFGAQRAVPVVSGVVVAEENEEAIIQAWRIDEEERIKKEEGKREKMALAMWRKLLMGMRILARVRDEYGGSDGHILDEVNPFTNRNKSTSNAKLKPGARQETERDDPLNGNDDASMGRFLQHARDMEEQQAGGFFLPGHEGEDASHQGGFIVEDEAGPVKRQKPTTVQSSPHTSAPETLSSSNPEPPSL